MSKENETWHRGGGGIYFVINEEYSLKIFIIKSIKNNNQSIYREKNINYNACLNYKWMPIVKIRRSYPAAVSSCFPVDKIN